ncbi:Metal-dependent phosphoesterase [Spironucleus salmonicida]|uniref:Metal-dependent phosphoesterase n=1 Tax=Spironucleus salmonicida TaxID=348837 RepID=V6LQV7_9EUKA|nr:Metal-dependent phosphoesterase [Spironucleus salmonicida]|eukprot:EST46633.1 PHP domain-containing protein [Spironucleus salmonicida]
MLIDLHSHSTHSDGSYSPFLLIQHAIALNLTYFAITDHDNIDSIKTLEKYKFPHNFTYIPGVEITTKSKCNNEIYHLIVLFPSKMKPNITPFADIFEIQKKDRKIRMEKLWIKIQETNNLNQSYQDFQTYFGTLNSTQVQKIHFAQFLTIKNICVDINSCFKTHLDIVVKSSEYLLLEDMIALAKHENAYPILAHPYYLAKNKSSVDKCIPIYQTLGLRALEVEHPEQDSDQRDNLRKLARELGLQVSIAGDFHGPEREKNGYFLGNLEGNKRTMEWEKVYLMKDMGYNSGMDIQKGLAMSVALLAQIGVVIFMACRG